MFNMPHRGTGSGEKAPKQEKPEKTTQGQMIAMQPRPRQAPPVQTPPVQTPPPQMPPPQITPLQITPLQNAPIQAIPWQTTPLQNAPIQTIPWQTTPMQTTPMQGTLGQATPLQTTPMQGTLGQMAPMQTTPMQGTPMQTTPGQMTMPWQTLPGQMMPGSAAPRRRPPARDTQLINDINEAIIREAHAYNYYARLAELATDMRNRQTLLRIQQDEAKHYGWFTTLMQRAGLPLPMIPPGALPRTFDEGVRAAIRDETQAVPFYQSIAARAQNRNTQVQFRNAARDEQEHATLLLSMITIL